MFQHDAKHTGIGEAIGPSYFWIKVQKSIEYKIITGIVVDKDKNIYFGTQAGYVISLDSLGNERWRFKTNGFVYSTPVVEEDVVYFGSFDGNVYAVNRRNGNTLWVKNIEKSVTSSIALHAGFLYLAAKDMIYCINRTNGTVKWSYTLDQEVISTPAVDDEENVYVQSFYGGIMQGIFCINSGTQRWFLPTGGGTGSAVVVNDGIVIGGSSGTLYAVSKDGSIKWTKEIGRSLETTPAVGFSGRIYVGSEEGNVYAIDTLGKVLWIKEIGEKIITPPLVDRKENIFIGTDEGRVISFDKDGNILWQNTPGYRIDLPMAMDSEGSIYLVDADTTILISIPGTGIEEDKKEISSPFIFFIPLGTKTSLPFKDFSLYSVNGALLGKFNNGVIETSNLSKGVYFVRSRDKLAKLVIK